MDVDGTLSLTLQEFITGCDRFGVALQKGEANEIFTAIDRDNSGSVSFDEFIESLRVSPPSCAFFPPVQICDILFRSARLCSLR